MTSAVSHIQHLVELWSRRGNPDAHDVRGALEVARALNADPSSPTALRALAWRVLGEVHDTAGWSLDDEPLPLCSSAATSVRHTNTLLIDHVLRELRAVEGPILVAGALGASRSLFGRWDILPAVGAVLMPLDDGSDRPDRGGLGTDSAFRLRGTRWAAAPPTLREAAREWPPVTLRDCQVRVPPSEVLAAHAANAARQADDIETLVFCAAAFEAVTVGRWSEIRSFASELGAPDAATECAIRLGLERWLQLDMSSARKLGLSLKRLFVAPILKRHGTVTSDRLP